jgi:hypothetical protein
MILVYHFQNDKKNSHQLLKSEVKGMRKKNVIYHALLPVNWSSFNSGSAFISERERLHQSLVLKVGVL